VQGIGALERGERRTPQRETLSLLTNALALGTEERATFEAAAARQSAPRATRSVATGLWPKAATSNLPIALTDIIGRGTELAEIAALLHEHRLVTLTGTGGIGKTTVALEVARAFYDDPAGGGAAWLVELAPLTDQQFVTATIAGALGVQEISHRSLLETLLAYLRPKNVLLVLDNCEHVIVEAAHVVDALLRGSPGMRILATSREPLRVGGERAYRLPPLAAPVLEDFTGSRRLCTAEVATFPAVHLFVERAQAVDRHFSLTDENAPLVAEICGRLEGIPLAIELAAARVTAISLPALLGKLTRQLALLGGGDRTALARQQTMRATIEWSYELLSEPERRLFEGFSVFSGGCALEAAAAVFAGDEEVQSDVFELLSSLVDKSLIVADVDGRAPRYRMLEMFRQYARERLAAQGALDAVCGRHAAAYFEIAGRLAAEARERPDREWHGPARLELDNWRAALEWALGAQNDIVLGQRLASRLKAVWHSFGASEGLRWIRLALDRGFERTEPSLVAELECVDADLSSEIGDFGAALAAALRALERYRDLADPIGIARAGAEAGNVLVRLGRSPEAEPLLHEALLVAQTYGRGALTARILMTLAEAQALRGDFAESRASFAEGLAAYRALGKERALTTALIMRAEIDFLAGDAQEAVRLSAAALTACRQQADGDSLEPVINANMAAYLVTLGRYAEAGSYARAALEVSQRLQLLLPETWALQHLAAIAVLEPQMNAPAAEASSRAARLIGFVEERYRELGAAPEQTERQEYDRVLAALREALPADELDVSLARGAAMSEEEAIEVALQL